MLHLQKNKNEPLIRIGHLKKSFGDVTPVKDVSCDIYQRDVISIIGPSGTGKSTLLNLINHLETADSGTILPTLGMDDEIRMVYEYKDADGGTVDLEVTYPGEDRNPLEEGDGLSLTLTRHACSMLDWEYEDGICRIKGRLVQT
jgi:ABC-type phosphonate transport system ATPase subunit